MWHQGAPRRDLIWGRLDPVVARLAQWADEDPVAMRRLIRDPKLRTQLLAALDAVVPGEGEAATRTG